MFSWCEWGISQIEGVVKDRTKYNNIDKTNVYRRKVIVIVKRLKGSWHLKVNSCSLNCSSVRTSRVSSKSFLEEFPILNEPTCESRALRYYVYPPTLPGDSHAKATLLTFRQWHMTVRGTTSFHIGENLLYFIIPKQLSAVGSVNIS